MIVLLVAALIGSSVTFALLWPYGALAAFAGAPLGGSLMAGCAGLLLALLQKRAALGHERHVQTPLEKPKAAA